MSDLSEQAVRELAEALRSDGWCHRPRFLGAATVAALRADLESRRGEFSAAGIGRAQQRRQEASVRADATLWLTGDSTAQRNFLDTMTTLQMALNRYLYLGLHDFEAHYAHYAAGAFYRRHLDAFSDTSDDRSGQRAPRRLLSTVCYLNEAWRDGDGGELILWDRNDRELMRIAPSAGAAVFFLSDEFPHEVLPAEAERYSIAGWFRSASPFPNGGNAHD